MIGYVVSRNRNTFSTHLEQSFQFRFLQKELDLKVKLKNSIKIYVAALYHNSIVGAACMNIMMSERLFSEVM